MAHASAPTVPVLDESMLNGMTLLDAGKALGRTRLAEGLTAIDYDQSGGVVRESVAADGTVVRESASTSDLPGLMANLLYRRLDNWFRQFDPAFKTYGHEEQVQNYKTNTIVFSSQLEDAVQIYQESDYRDSGISDKILQFSLNKWGRYISLPFKMIENDDLQYINAMPRRMTDAVERTMSKIVVRQTFEANPITYDGLPVFSANRPVAQQASALTGNFVSGAGSGLSLANIGAGLAAVNSFTGDPDLNPSGVPLNTPGKYLVVPAALAQQAAQILNSTTLLAAGTSNPVSLTANRNPVRETILQPILQPVVERYLVNSTAWYILPEADDGPLMYITRRGKGMRPRLWRNIPMRQGIQGGNTDDYLLLVDDQIFGFDFDLSGVSYKPWASVKFAGA